MTDDDKKLCEREIIDRFMAIPSAQHGEGRMFTLDEAKVVISHIEALSAEVEGLRERTVVLEVGVKDALHAITLVAERDGLMDDEADYEAKARATTIHARR